MIWTNTICSLYRKYVFNIKKDCPSDGLSFLLSSPFRGDWGGADVNALRVWLKHSSSLTQSLFIFYTTQRYYPRFLSLNWPFSDKIPSKWGRDTEIPRRSHVCKVEGKHQKKGFLHVFWGLWEQDFDAFCPFSEGRHLGCSLITDIVFHWFSAF